MELVVAVLPVHKLLNFAVLKINLYAVLFAVSVAGLETVFHGLLHNYMVIVVAVLAEDVIFLSVFKNSRISIK
jgi:hypothetical protein